ncbi:MAG: response regulator [Bacteroidota bacterium]
MQNETIKILLADDDSDDRLFFQEAFEEIKIKTIVQTVKDGVELMSYLKSSDQLPHILFLDLNMPRKSGMDCLKEIRRIDRLKDMAIAIYSTSSTEDDIEETFVQGANVYIKKPSDFLVLKKLLSQVISINWQYHSSGLNKSNFMLSL